MKKVISIILIALLLICLSFISQYHLNLSGAWSELEKEWDGEVIAPNSEKDTKAILIDNGGNIFVGISYHTDIVVIYRDFTIYPTNLNIYNLPNHDECYFSKVEGYGAKYERYITLTTNPDVEWLYLGGSDDKRLFSLEEHVKSNKLKRQLKNVKSLFFDIPVGMPWRSPEP